MMFKISQLLILLCFILFCDCESQLNPYKVLNVPRNAKLSEIRQSYKTLVREWHPDKNRSPNAEEKFIEIQQAYEILSNSEKRSQYDSQGSYSSNQNHYHQRNAQNFRYSNFEDFFDFGFDSEVSTRSVSYTQFIKKVLPNSYHTPQVLFFYQRFSARSIYILKTTWERTAKDLEKLGIGVGTVDVSFSSKISSHFRISSLKNLVMILEEEHYYYSGDVSQENIKNFINSQLPKKYLVQTVGPSNIDSFLNGITVDDKPRALLFSKQAQPTLLYTLMAIKHKKYIKFGFASLTDSDAKVMGKNFGVKGTGPTLLVFKEDINNPAVTLQSSDMPRGAVNEILTMHRYMIVPRLTSQDVFDDVCAAPDGRSYHVSLCAVFATNDKWEGHTRSLNNLRSIVSDAMENDDQLSDWLKFVFVLTTKQQAFVTSLSEDEELPDKPVIYLLWRRGPWRSYVSTFSSKFLDSEVSLEYGFQKFLASCLRSSNQRQFEREIRLSPLNDELAPFFLIRLASRAWKSAVGLIGYIGSKGEQDTMLALITFVIIGISAVWNFINRIFSDDRPSRRDEDHQDVHERSNRSNAWRKERRDWESDNEDDDIEIEITSSDAEDEIAESKTEHNLQELRPSTYDQLVLRQKRGCMTFVLLMDKNDHVITDFVQLMKKYQSESHLSFSFLDASSYSSWYVELRKTSSPTKDHDEESRDGLSSLHSGARLPSGSTDFVSASVHGTVLALNGSKHWYCMFVPRSRRRQANQATNGPVDDLFCGGDYNSEEEYSAKADSSNSSYDDASEYSANLSLWFDRVQDGQWPRFYVRQWPGLYVRTPDHSDSECD